MGSINGKMRIKAIFDGQPTDRVGFWAGFPVEETLLIYYKYFKVNNYDELTMKLGDDVRWLPAEEYAWKHPEGMPIWNTHKGQRKKALDQAGVFAECEDVKEIELFDWPNPDYMDYTSVIQKIDIVSKLGRFIFGGPWTYIFQIAADFFGMENFLIKMYTDPIVVEALIERIIDFYLIVNGKFFEQAGDKLGVFFFANDLGSQEDLLMSPELFRKYLLPGFKKIINQAKKYGYKVLFHSCGAISKVIPDLIDAGIDGLHPLQSKAKGMNAEYLAKEYKRDIVFVGGVDTQELLPFGTVDEVKKEVRRLKRVFGERFIVSPSHEGVLPNIPTENIVAMREAALEY